MNAKKAGHTGTLDPFATGLLPLCFGEATKFSQDLLEADKTYDATVHLGIMTTTGDTEGEAIETLPVDVTHRTDPGGAGAFSRPDPAGAADVLGPQARRQGLCTNTRAKASRWSAKRGR